MTNKSPLLIGDILLVTLDTLRFDVAHRAWTERRLPNLSRWLPENGWELRHAPGNFTYASHQAMFAGFLPTPATPGRHLRRFALRFEGSETVGEETIVFDAPNIVQGFAERGYRTICIGGVGFFNKRNPLGNVLPSLFHESYWESRFSVADRNSTQNQFEWAAAKLQEIDRGKRIFMFINVSALHQPNCMYVDGAASDSVETQLAALEYVDSQWPLLMNAFTMRGAGFGIICSDHGTAYGEDGFHGHRLSHRTVWDVPYAEYFWSSK